MTASARQDLVETGLIALVCYYGKCKKSNNLITIICYIDIDECQANPCDYNAQCHNTIGSFSCECNIGYYGSGPVCSKLLTPV